MIYKWIYFILSRMGGYVLDLHISPSCKKVLSVKELGFNMLFDLKKVKHILTFKRVKGNLSSWNKASSNHNKYGSWNSRKTCCRPGDSSCESLWQTFLVQLATASSLSHSLHPVSGIELPFLIWMIINSGWGAGTFSELGATYMCVCLDIISHIFMFWWPGF